MTWDDALNFCQSAGLRGLSLGSSKTEEDVEELMSKALDSDLKMETFWVAGYVLHPIFDGSVRIGIVQDVPSASVVGLGWVDF